MLVIGRVPARFLLPLGAAAAIAAPLMITLLQPYQLERLGTFLVGSQESSTGSGWALRQAHIAVASGGLFGRTDDPLRGLRAQYLPERDTDLALSSLVGQWGLVAGAGVVLAAIILVWRLALASRTSRTPHGALVGRRTGDPAGSGDRRLGRRQSRAAAAGRRPLSTGQLRRDRAGRPPGRDRGGPVGPRRTAPAGGCGRCPGGGIHGRGWSGWRRWRCQSCCSSFGLYGWRLQTTQGEALRGVAQQQMTRCIRLPAPRGSITDRHDAPLAVNAADVGAGVDQVLVVPALLRAPAGGRRPARAAHRAAGRRPHRPAPGDPGHHAVAGRRRGSAPGRRRRDRGSDTRCAGRRGAAPYLSAGCAAGAGARLRRGGHPGRREALARPALGRDRRPRRARAGVRRRAAGDRRPSVRVRRPGGRPRRARRAAASRSRRGPPALPRPGAAAATGRRHRRLPARAAPAGRQGGRGRRHGSPVGAGPRHRERPVVRRQRVRTAGRRRCPEGAGGGPGFTDARARDPGGRATRLDVQAGHGRGQPGSSGARAPTRSSPPGPSSPTAATSSTTGSRWGRWTWSSRSPSPTTSTSTSSPSPSAPTRSSAPPRRSGWDSAPASTFPASPPDTSAPPNRSRRRAARGTAGRPSSWASDRGSCRSLLCRTPGGPPLSPPATW